MKYNIGDTVMTLQGPKVIVSMNDEVVRFDDGFAPIDRVSIMTADERIKEQSIKYQSKVAGENQNIVRHTYRYAAKYERNKTIDEAIVICYEYLNSTYASVVVEQLETLRLK